MKKQLFLIKLLILVLLVPVQVSSQKIDLDQVNAQENLRLGIVSWHSGEFNKSILSLEKALSLKPDWSVTKVWLGNAYYKSGFVDKALSYWKEVVASGEGSTNLKVMVDNVLYRRNMGPMLKEDSRYVVYHEIDGTTPEYTIFSRPGSLVPTSDGGLYVTSFAGNTILKVSANGVKKEDIIGGIEGINHPFDVIKTNKYLFFTAYGADQIVRYELKGGHLLRFGSSGSLEGQLLGPQFIADDESGYLYVTDTGNKQISKFSFDGDFVLSFGKVTSNFEGFSEPTGITITDDKILAADKRKSKLFLFDKSGNYLRSFSSRLMKSPEGISSLSDGRFLIADSDQILLFDKKEETFSVVSRQLGVNSLILKAVQDINGNIVCVDFNRNKLLYLADISRMYSGLNVFIDRIVSDNFPQVSVEVSVSALDGTPIVGLEDNNFLVTESSYPLNGAKLIYPGSKKPVANISLLLEGSGDMKGKAVMRQNLLNDLIGSLGSSGTIGVVTAEGTPVVESAASSDPKMLQRAVLHEGEYDSSWRFDLGVRLSVSELVQMSDRRGIVFFSSGNLPPLAFSKYSLDETLQYLLNNRITFYVVVPGEKDSAAPELNYLAEKTGGEVMSLYRPTGVGSIISRLEGKSVGTYVLEFSTGLDSDYGRKPLPLEVQVSLFGRSGRGESLYYAPFK